MKVFTSHSNERISQRRFQESKVIETIDTGKMFYRRKISHFHIKEISYLILN